MQMNAVNSINLDFQHSHHLSSRLTNGKLPFWPTATIPVFEKWRQALHYNQPVVSGTLKEIRNLKLFAGRTLYQKFLGWNWCPSMHAIIVCWPSTVFPYTCNTQMAWKIWLKCSLYCLDNNFVTIYGVTYRTHSSRVVLFDVGTKGCITGISPASQGCFSFIWLHVTHLFS